MVSCIASGFRGVIEDTGLCGVQSCLACYVACAQADMGAQHTSTAIRLVLFSPNKLLPHKTGHVVFQEYDLNGSLALQF